MTIEIGTRIRFTRTLDAPASDEHPAILYARKGQLGRIVSIGDCWEGFRAVADGWPNSFGVMREEFEVVGKDGET